MADGSCSKELGRMAVFTCGVNRDIASISWNAPLVMEFDSADPARKRVGKAFADEFPT
jgi:hypothetical protein